MDTIDRDKAATKPAAKPSGKAKAPRVKTAKGEIDHGAVTNEIIARFPNILKALAE